MLCAHTYLVNQPTHNTAVNNSHHHHLHHHYTGHSDKKLLPPRPLNHPQVTPTPHHTTSHTFPLFKTSAKRPLSVSPSHPKHTHDTHTPQRLRVSSVRLRREANRCGTHGTTLTHAPFTFNTFSLARSWAFTQVLSPADSNAAASPLRRRMPFLCVCACVKMCRRV